MTDTPVSKIQILESFEEILNRSIDHELAKSAFLRGEEMDPSTLVRRKSVTPSSLKEKYQSINDEISKSISTILGDDNGEIGSIVDLQVVSAMGDFANRMRRAESLRHASFARRTVHAAMRRNSHGRDGGYLKRRVRGRIVERLTIAKS